MAVRTLNARGISEIPQRELVRACYAAPLAAPLAGFSAAFRAHVEALRGLDPLALFPRIRSLQLLLNIFGDSADSFLFFAKVWRVRWRNFPVGPGEFCLCSRSIIRFIFIYS
jgi:hypothetical protein